MNNISPIILEIITSTLINTLILIIPLILSVAYLTLAERRIIGWMQQRQGPNVTGPFGLLQPIADALKLLFKEPIIPIHADKILFLLAPVLTFTLAFLGWAVIPIGKFAIADINVGILYLLAVSSLGVYGIIIAGYASGSKYAFLGAIRSAAQIISYEIPMGICMLCVMLVHNTLNLRELVTAQSQMSLYHQLLLIVPAIIFFISMLAETNRHPFDLPEAESELVAGFNVEYSSIPFALFFLGEYANMILMSSIFVILFAGGWLPPFNLAWLQFLPPLFWFVAKVSFCLFIFIWVRATTPRYRFDQLMRIGWKIFLPITLFCFILLANVTFFLGRPIG